MALLVLLEPVLQVLVPVWMAPCPVSLGQASPVQGLQGLPVQELRAPECLAAMLSLLAALRVLWPAYLIPS